MVAHASETTMTVEEYLALEETSQIKHEYVDGHVYAMSGGTSARDRIANNVRIALDTHLGDGPCAVHGPDLRLRISPTVYYYPDALVICDENIGDDAIEVTTPRLIVEVLSDSTEAHDRGQKFAHYQALVTLEEYLLIDARRRVVECFRRGGPSLWTYQRYAPHESVTLDTIALSYPIATFYRRTRL